MVFHSEASWQCNPRAILVQSSVNTGRRQQGRDGLMQVETEHSQFQRSVRKVTIALGISADHTACVGTRPHRRAFIWMTTPVSANLVFSCSQSQKMELHTCKNTEDCPDAEFSHDCNRRSCGVPIAIDNADHEPSSSVKFNETVTYEGHSGYSLDGEPDVNRSFTTNVWCCSKWIHGGLSHSRHQRSEDHL